MNELQLVGQTITSTNYTTRRLFDFNPELVQAAAETFLSCGVAELEVPQGVLDPNGKCPDKGIDEDTLEKTKSLLPGETKVLGTYLGSGGLGADNAAYLKQQKRALSLLVEHFPDLRYAMLHPAGKNVAGADAIGSVVDAYAELAAHAVTLRPDFQLCWHNHFDSSGESAEGVRAYLDAIAAVDHPGLRWGPDTGHCHGMGDEYLAVFEANAHLIGDFFHIKARVPAFDRLHGGDAYSEERDIWSNKAEVGGGLYSGFVNVADPEITTPFQDVFRLIREKARPTAGVVRGALEIDIPRQHPRLEVLCAALYLKNVHGVEGSQRLSNDEMIRRVFA